MGLRLLFLAAVAIAAPASAVLPSEPVPNVAKIPVPWAAHWIVIHDFAFGSLIDSKFSLVDADSRTFLGMVSAGQFATVNLASTRREIYVGETYHSRGSRGERTDLVTVYDMENLAIVAEIEIPPRRANIVVNKSNTALLDDETRLIVLNFNPATSVSVIDTVGHKFIDEIAIPGCAMVYAAGKRRFFTLCGDGSLLSIELDEGGAAAARTRSEPFIDIDAAPLSEKAARIGGTWYFISYAGAVQPIDVEPTPKPTQRWWLANPDERAAAWRPAGWHWTAAHPDGRLFVSMAPNGYQGSHKDPAAEVWVFDAQKQSRLLRIPLATAGLSIEVTSDSAPRLLVANVEGKVDVYDATKGELLHTIAEVGETPYMIHRTN